MKKTLAVLLVLVMMLALAGTALAGDSGRNGKSGRGQLYLYEKDSNWDIVPGGMWGKMNYRATADGPHNVTYDFVFNGHDLVPEEGYELVVYKEDWPNATSLGSDMACEYGDVHIAGIFTVPAGDVVKVWLVRSDDFDTDHLTAWNPSMYLFEHHVLPEPAWHD